ncbi:MAG: MBL fold metallo-hydrolase [Tannerella sp.]|jgi:phosphoribosyl 1,2-cyclic phosphodiesterase|nr:MBL fold metallo-hydrolase [Tannerella sp.]
MKLSFLSLASGSSGNCYYVGTAEYGILIDAGIGLRQIKKTLKDRGVDFDRIEALLVTHDHADHIKTAGILGEKCGLPVYTTARVHDGIDRSRYVGETLHASRRTIAKETPFAIRDLRIEAFEVPHDSFDCVGYEIECDGCRFTIATDVGHISPTVARYLRRARHIVLEANYDEEMLRNGSYPDFLKERVAGDGGHLSNREAADFLALNYTPSWRTVWLCHLSRENNHPELAGRTVDLRLAQAGISVGRDLALHVLGRTTPSGIFTLD